MDVTPLIPEGRQIIQGYSATGFKVSGVLYEGAVIVTPVKTWGWDAPPSFSALKAADFSKIEGAEIDVLLLGAGNKGAFLPPALKQELKSKGWIAEVMDTGAACRTYNVLMAEGRRVAAALLPL
jgi:uncharacterized protein